MEFPLELDLAPFCSSTAFSAPNVGAGAREIKYALYAVVEHSGRLQGRRMFSRVCISAASLLNRDGLKGGPVVLSNSQAWPGRKF